jgi:membrane protease YdiL (CAAX protease family)
LRAPPDVLSAWVTGLWAAVLAILVGWLFLPSPSATPLAELERPERSLERLASRELDYRGALGRAPTWEQAIYRALRWADDPLADLIAWYDELIAATDAPRARLYRAVLLAENDRAGTVVYHARAGPRTNAGPMHRDEPRDRDEIIGRDETRDRVEAMDGMEEWLRAAYGDPALDQETGQRIIADIRASLPPGWFVDTLVRRIASRIGDSLTEQETAAASAARAQTLLGRWRILIAGGLALLALSAIAGGWLVARRASLRLADARLPPPWTTRDGYGLFIRSALGLLATGLLVSLLVPSEAVFENLSLVAGAVPMMWWTTRCLEARGASLGETFGVIPRPGMRARLLAVTLGLIGLSIAAEALIGVGAGALGINEHWTEGFPEELLWASPGAAGAITVAAILWTPAVEELLFRGILYATLRTSIGVWPAAVVSAAMFALGHGYGAVGFAAVFWSGTLWALSYEWTRCLLPAMLAHAANNLIATLAFVWLIRLG